MHVMFIHPSFPAQFGQLAFYLATQMRWDCTYVTSVDTTQLQLPFNHINYRVFEGPQPKVFYNPEDVHGLMEHMLSIYRGLRNVPQLTPDLVVGHMSYGTMLYLRTLYSCPFVGFFEMLPPPFWTDAMVLRKEFPPPEGVRLFNATYNALTHLHYHAADAVYTPTHFQMSTAPREWHHKFQVFFDGIDTNFFQPRVPERPLNFQGLTIRPDMRFVTFVSRGLESIRGFDIFMQAAKRIAAAMPDVHFLIAGEERTNYGHEAHHLGEQSFKQYVLSKDEYDLSRFHFLGVIPGQDLATLFNLSDLHIYLTVPYVLSWSMLQAMATGCLILGSATAPVQEAIDDGVHGLLVDFYDVDGLAARALQMLRDPAQYQPLRQAARARAVERYDAQKCCTDLAQFFESFQTRSRDEMFAALAAPQP